MRKKESKLTTFGVVDGLEFNDTFIGDEQIERPNSQKNFIKRDTIIVPSSKKHDTNITQEQTIEIDPNRKYSKYYQPKPRKGNKGGYLGRGSVDEKDRKVQFSVTVTPTQKERFMEAAKKDHRKLPDFICVAVEKYIEDNGL